MLCQYLQLNFIVLVKKLQLLLSYSKCKHLQTETKNNIGTIRGKIEIENLREE
jgi:hypothetical protein